MNEQLTKGPDSTDGPSVFPDDADVSVLPAFSDDGTDLTLIRWMLSLTPLERLRVAQRYANSARKLRNARRRV